MCNFSNFSLPFLHSFNRESNIAHYMTSYMTSFLGISSPLAIKLFTLLTARVKADTRLFGGFFVL